MRREDKKEVIIYQAKNGAIEFQHDTKKETIWANINQIADLFGVQKSAISKHLKNIFDSRELSKKVTVSKMETVQLEGQRKVRRFIEKYNLDVIVAVGYRVNSKKATQFRIWATKVLRQYITKGFVIDKKIIAKNYSEFQKAIQDVKEILPAGTKIDNKSIIELISAFAETWLSLDAYDKDILTVRGFTKKSVKFSAEDLNKALLDFREILIKKKEATEIFGRERESDAVGGIFGNVMQSFSGRELYPTVEEKAAHLLYFMVKNHSFIDGNKRNGAYAFVWFLKKAGILDFSKINPASLTAITLLLAESNPRHKDKMVRLVLQFLKK